MRFEVRSECVLRCVQNARSERSVGAGRGSPAVQNAFLNARVQNIFYSVVYI